VARITETHFECDLCGERCDHYATIARSAFCGMAKDELCKPAATKENHNEL
jgi:hypothetical protein